MSEDRKPYGVIRSAMVILPELRDGQVVTELSGAIHDALAAVRQHNKAAEVILRVKIEPATEQRLVEAPIAMTATIETKLPKEVPPGDHLLRRRVRQPHPPDAAPAWGAAPGEWTLQAGAVTLANPGCMHLRYAASAPATINPDPRATYLTVTRIGD